MSQRKAYKNLAEFVRILDEAGELIRIPYEVSPNLEISEFYLREVQKYESSKALLFENVSGSKIPVLINSFGSFKRLQLAFGGADLESLAQELKAYTDLVIPQDFLSKLKKLIYLAQVRKFLPKRVRKAECQEIVTIGSEVDLTQIPILKTWPQDGGPFITFPLVFTKSLDGRKRNCGMYRMQIYDKNTTGMHWQIHKDGSHFHGEYRRAKQRMEVAVAIGGDPSLVYAATAPLPPGIFEMLIAGFIRNSGVEMVRCKTIDMEVPANADIVLEGYVDPDELRSEGPFGDHTGYYTLEELYPVFHVTAITMKRNPIYLTTVVGRSPQEDCYLAKASERLFLPLLQVVEPAVLDYLLPWDANFHNSVIIKVAKQFPHHAKRILSHLWGFSQMSFSKSIIAVDEAVQLSDDESMIHFLLNRLNISTDIIITQGIVDALDHASYQFAYGGKIGIDLTSKIENEDGFAVPRDAKKFDLSNAPCLKLLQDNFDSVLDCRIYGHNCLNRVLLVKVKKEGKGQIGKAIGQFVFNALQSIDICIVFDEKNDLNDGHKIMWRIFNNTDWAQDLYFNSERNKIAIDCSSKNSEDNFQRRWPDDLIMSESIIKKVDQYLNA